MIDISKYESERARISKGQFDDEYITCYRKEVVQKIVSEANVEIAKLNGIIEGLKDMAMLVGRPKTEEGPECTT